MNTVLASLADCDYLALQRPPRESVQSREWFVRQQHARLNGQRARKEEQPLCQLSEGKKPSKRRSEGLDGADGDIVGTAPRTEAV